MAFGKFPNAMSFPVRGITKERITAKKKEAGLT
jgi:hypothetical protein